MALVRRALLLAVAIALMSTTFSSSVRQKVAEDAQEESELIELLEEVRQRLHDNEAAGAKSPVQSVHDNVNEERWYEVFDSDDQGRIIHVDQRAAERTLAADQVTQLVDYINEKRRGEGASDMYMIHWNEKLAALALKWSSQCDYRHGSPPFNGDDVGVFQVGTNLWAFTGDFNAKAVVDEWYGDKANFDPNTEKCAKGQPCGGYKQLVNSFTTDVGCGMTTCPSVAGISNANFIVCYFGPPGNVHGVATYHKDGPACSTCKHGQFYCNNGLCDKTCHSAGANCECKAVCKNCGTQTSDCKCTCKPGSSGPNCAEPCADFSDNCGKQKGGWPHTMCGSAFYFVQEICPKMCKVCTEGTPCGRENF